MSINIFTISLLSFSFALLFGFAVFMSSHFLFQRIYLIFAVTVDLSSLFCFFAFSPRKRKYGEIYRKWNANATSVPFDRNRLQLIFKTEFKGKRKKKLAMITQLELPMCIAARTLSFHLIISNGISQNVQYNVSSVHMIKSTSTESPWLIQTIIIFVALRIANMHGF